MASAALSLALALTASVAAPQDGFDQIWSESRRQFEAEGISRNVARAAFVWTEGQYHLGLCRRYVPQDQVDHWRHWWSSTRLPDTQIGRAILAVGADAYTRGLEDGAVSPISAAQCQRIADAWFQDMQAAASARE